MIEHRRRQPLNFCAALRAGIRYWLEPDWYPDIRLPGCIEFAGKAGVLHHAARVVPASFPADHQSPSLVRVFFCDGRPLECLVLFQCFLQNWGNQQKSAALSGNCVHGKADPKSFFEYKND